MIMNMKTMNINNECTNMRANYYEAPMLEIFEVVVEKGFAYSEGGAFEDEWGDIITPGMR